MRFFLPALILLFLAACVPTSESPLSQPDSADLDREILGTWFWNQPGETGYVHIGIDRETGLLRVLMVEFKQDGDLKESEFSGHTSIVGDRHYLNLKWVRPSEASANGYMLIGYRLSPGKLSIAVMSSEPVETAIGSGIISGSVTKETWSTSVRITASQENLRAFISKNDELLFPEMNSLNRLDLPLTSDS